MKRLFILVLLMALFTSIMFSQAEVSQRKDVAVLPAYSSINIPDSAYQYFDDTMMAILNSMKRFQVIGYQYRLDNNSAETFIQKVQEAKKQAALQNPQYMDADLGIAVIPAAEMQRIANSFFVFIPSISGFSVSEHQIKIEENKKGKITIRIATEYIANVTISIKIITAGGNLMNTYYKSIESKSQSSSMDAYQQAISGALGGLEFHLRTVEEFKIKTRVLKVDNDYVYLELGREIGVEPGYEFYIQKETKVLDQFTEKISTGLVRINTIGDKWSAASTIFGNPQVGDQLVEAPMTGGRFNILLGMVPMALSSSELLIQYDAPGISFTSTESFAKSSYVFNAGINFEYELGYAGLVDFTIGALFGNPFALSADLGGGYELYFGSMSLTLGADLSFVGMIKPLGTKNNTNTVTIKGTDFDDNIDITLMGGTIGIKPKITFNYQIGQHMKIRLTGGYALYFAPFYYLNFQSASDSKTSAAVDIAESSVTMLLNGNKVSTLPIDFSGPYGGIELVFRF